MISLRKSWFLENIWNVHTLAAAWVWLFFPGSGSIEGQYPQPPYPMILSHTGLYYIYVYIHTYIYIYREREREREIERAAPSAASPCRGWKVIERQHGRLGLSLFVGHVVVCAFVSWCLCLSSIAVNCFTVSLLSSVIRKNTVSLLLMIYECQAAGLW